MQKEFFIPLIVPELRADKQTLKPYCISIDLYGLYGEVMPIYTYQGAGVIRWNASVGRLEQCFHLANL